MRELGRAGGKASGEARRKRKRRSLLTTLRGHVSSNPEEFVEQLLASPPGAVKAAAMLERYGFTDEEEQAQTDAPLRVGGGGGVTSMADCVAFAYSSGSPASWGLPTSHDELDALLATAEPPPTPPEKSRNPASTRAPLTFPTAGGQPSDSTPRGPHSAGEKKPKKQDPLLAQAIHERQRRAELEAEGWDAIPDPGITLEEELQLKAERRAQRERWETNP